MTKKSRAQTEDNNLRELPRKTNLLIHFCGSREQLQKSTLGQLPYKTALKLFEKKIQTFKTSIICQLYGMTHTVLVISDFGDF